MRGWFFFFPCRMHCVFEILGHSFQISPLVHDEFQHLAVQFRNKGTYQIFRTKRLHKFWHSSLKLRFRCFTGTYTLVRFSGQSITEKVDRSVSESRYRFRIPMAKRKKGRSMNNTKYRRILDTHCCCFILLFFLVSLLQPIVLKYLLPR